MTAELGAWMDSLATEQMHSIQAAAGVLREVGHPAMHHTTPPQETQAT